MRRDVWIHEIRELNEDVGEMELNLNWVELTLAYAWLATVLPAVTVSLTATGELTGYREPVTITCCLAN